jgi:hypothetical protein
VSLKRSMWKRWFGPVLVGVDWASDGKWDWTSDVGDKHTDFASVARCVREDNPPLWRVTLGPLSVSFIKVVHQGVTMRGREWGVWCVGKERSLWYEVEKGVPLAMTLDEAQKKAREINDVGAYRAKVMPLASPEGSS